VADGWETQQIEFMRQQNQQRLEQLTDALNLKVPGFSSLADTAQRAKSAIIASHSTPQL